MAVEKKYALDELEATYPQSNFKKEGQVLNSVISRVTVAAPDSDGSVYGVAVIPGEACIKDIKIATTAITNGTDYDIGLYRYKADGTIGAVIAMILFRHKIKKGEFLIKFFVVSLVQFEIIYFIVKG